jgi:hypothetical protein
MLVRNISDQLDCLHWFILSKHKEAVSEISNIFIAFSPFPTHAVAPRARKDREIF